MRCAWPASLSLSPSTQLMSPDMCWMSGKNNSWLPHRVYKKIQPWVVKKNLQRSGTKISPLDYSEITAEGGKAWERRGEERGELVFYTQDEKEKQKRFRKKAKIFLHPVGGVSSLCGQRRRRLSIWSPFSWAGWTGPSKMEPVARGERDALGRTRAWHKQSTKCAFKQQPKASQPL